MTSTRDSPGRLDLTGPARRTVLATAVALAATICTLGSPASAQDPRDAVVPAVMPASQKTNLAYSSDGVEYSASFPVLFTAATKLVPGEGVAESLWIRNDNAMAVKVWLAVPASDGIEQVHLRVGLKPQPVVTLEPGASSELQAHVWLPESAGNDAQARLLPVRLQVNVGEVAETVLGEAVLGETGATSSIWPVGLAVLMGGVGALVASRKRSDRPVALTAPTGSSAPAAGGSS
ncbi:LPXTG cell wall anchor domain-containing protein [Arthrobacter glacialis]|uniref:LPXTG cell wall anchor domain-containing protein n=1 Tax=Arthrobacter glacialis TaxID=1664 RepID=UPI000CD49831|nr:LPXTG cell wall anchor domain-containing protein [Arthrobacter glacialis]POH60648.1 hypothetical protein CVS28_02970 [Arthrobacter glacialis]